ncbi:hypothetical protein BKA70DRAFT_1251786 [Coprinopsis sp. MPI-PUGE-AT-0042]|nr:hypothetical protein BKA70DRAFT_1251786 [Coprinopsis sp. MPI-PUGE-AT-0042]
MSETTSLLGSFASAPSSSAASSSTQMPTSLAALAKVRASSSSTLFTSASESFQPLPYSPHAPYGQPQNQAKGALTRHTSRSQDLPGMDPLPTDPSAVFIHPPFTDLPNAHEYPDGLKYEHFERNPEWFLDINDYVWENNTHTNPNAIKYPSNLEPARGWCKDKLERKDWPKGEEPRLRCTFCRRTYAGHNAKSMWRRHVLEKHKVPMSNRRDGNDKPGSRRSKNKENKRSSVQPAEQPHDQLLSMQVVPQMQPVDPPQKSKFRSLGKSQKKKKKSESPEPLSPALQPVSSASGHRSPSATVYHQRTVSTSSNESDQQVAPHDPPAFATTHDEPATFEPNSCTPPPTFLGIDHGDITDEIDFLPTPGPASPYDPHATPAFRHSPPPHPSKRPWKFDTPSHPMHSASRDFSLAMLIHDGSSPLEKAPAGAGSSPGGLQSSSFSTPNDSFLVTPSTSQLFNNKNFPRSWLVRKVAVNSPLSKHSRLSSADCSPMTQGSLSNLHRRTPSAANDDWLKHGALNLPPVQTPWRSLLSGSPARSFMEPESPIVHRAASSSTSSDSVPLGIGLLDPFVMIEGAPTSAEFEAELNQIGSKPSKLSRKRCPSDDSPEPSPSAKRRRLSFSD